MDQSTKRKEGLVLDRVVLLGRTMEEYRRCFALTDEDLRNRQILDVASGVSSFCAEANASGYRVTAFDRIYQAEPDAIGPRCGHDLDEVVRGMAGLSTYRWGFYQSPAGMRKFRERAYRTFLEDYPRGRGARYITGELPTLPFASDQFGLSLVSYLLFVYEDQFSYEFHRDSLLELSRVTQDEVRIYPTVTFEARRSTYLDRIKLDPALEHLEFREVPTDFEFLVGSNSYLSIRRKG
jgi:hypothetical protein